MRRIRKQDTPNMHAANKFFNFCSAYPTKRGNGAKIEMTICDVGRVNSRGGESSCEDSNEFRKQLTASGLEATPTERHRNITAPMEPGSLLHCCRALIIRWCLLSAFRCRSATVRSKVVETNHNRKVSKRPESLSSERYAFRWYMIAPRIMPPNRLHVRDRNPSFDRFLFHFSTLYSVLLYAHSLRSFWRNWVDELHTVMNCVYRMNGAYGCSK